MSDIFDHELDAWEDRIAREAAGDDEPNAYTTTNRIPRKKTCVRCNTSGLHWSETREGWRLFNIDNTLHVCDQPKDVEQTAVYISIKLIALYNQGKKPYRIKSSVFSEFGTTDYKPVMKVVASKMREQGYIFIELEDVDDYTVYAVEKLSVITKWKLLSKE
jgi:hypothetical protein